MNKVFYHVEFKVIFKNHCYLENNFFYTTELDSTEASYKTMLKDMDETIKKHANNEKETKDMRGSGSEIKSIQKHIYKLN